MLILMGPSASGKTEIAKILDKRYGIRKVITHTTREKRVSEVDGIDYYFVSKEVFENLLKENYFVETTIYNNNYYGTSRKEISDNKCVVLDPRGALKFKELNDSHIFIVYLSCEQNIRIARMVSRNDKPDKILSRIESDRYSFNETTPSIANIIIDSNSLNPDELAEKIFKLYLSHLG